MHRKTIIVATVLSLCGWLSAQQAVRLNELDINQIKQEYGTVTVRDSLVELYAKSIAKVKLDGKAERFVTQIRVGGERVSEHDPQVMVQPLVDGTKLLFREEAGSKRLVGIVGKDGKIADGSVRFIVKADGKVVHDSGILSPKVGTQTIDIPLKGVRMKARCSPKQQSIASGVKSTSCRFGKHYPPTKRLSTGC